MRTSPRTTPPRRRTSGPSWSCSATATWRRWARWRPSPAEPPSTPVRGLSHRRSRRSVATSDRILAYLGSTKNIVGSALAIGGLVLHFVGLAGSLWPVVVGGLYGVGALLTPPDRVRLTISHAEVETKRLRADLDALVSKVSSGARFPEDVGARVEGLAGI